MKRNLIIIAGIACLSIAFVLSCKKKGKLKAECDGSKPTYNGEIKAIINNNCMGSSCHVAGSPYGNFTTYNGLTPYISNGLFKRDVIELQIMPKNKKLSQSDINKIQCWIDNNYAEN